MDTTADDFDRLLAHVEEELGFATSHYNDSYLDRRITARMRRVGADSYEEYLGTLRGDDEEGDALLDSLSINVTGFFRNPEMWEGLRPILRELTEERRRVRVWSAPCSDGREPYSMAMLALDDPGIDASRLSITGSDISEEALAAARRGVYETTRTTDIEEELAPLEEYSTYVERDGDEFAVRDRVRESVDFRRHDLIREEPIGEFDLVMCRNLLIYIASEYKVPILDTVDGALSNGGYLVIGMTETLPREYRERYESVETGARIHRKDARSEPRHGRS